MMNVAAQLASYTYNPKKEDEMKPRGSTYQINTAESPLNQNESSSLVSGGLVS